MKPNLNAMLENRMPNTYTLKKHDHYFPNKIQPLSLG